MPFPTANRNAENKARYISRDHCMDALGHDSPGPSAYKIKSGKVLCLRGSRRHLLRGIFPDKWFLPFLLTFQGIARTVGDAPTWIFGTAEQHNDGINPSSRSYPGPGAHHLRPVLGPESEYTPSYSFAPMGDERLGKMRNKARSVPDARAASVMDVTRIVITTRFAVTSFSDSAMCLLMQPPLNFAE